MLKKVAAAAVTGMGLLMIGTPAFASQAGGQLSGVTPQSQDESSRHFSLVDMRNSTVLSDVDVCEVVAETVAAPLLSSNSSVPCVNNDLGRLEA